MTTNERIKLLRTELGLSQEVFGDKIGMKKSSISTIEKGVNNVTDIVAKSVCRAFNVNYFWLTEGKGDMFNAFPETILDEVVEQFELTKEDKLLLESYLEMSKEQRETIMIFLQTFAKKVQKKDEE